MSRKWLGLLPLLLLFPAAASLALNRPTAYFTVTSPVLPGQIVLYQDLSYGPGAPLHPYWTNRQPFWNVPGVYPVTLVVINHWGISSLPFTRNVVVLGPPAPTALRIWPNPAMRGEQVHVCATSPPPGPETLTLPPALIPTLRFNDGTMINYATLDGPLVLSPLRTCVTFPIPWSSSLPADGTYSLQVTGAGGIRTYALTVKGTMRMVEPVYQWQE